VVSFTPRPLYLQGNSPAVPIGQDSLTCNLLKPPRTLHSLQNVCCIKNIYLKLLLAVIFIYLLRNSEYHILTILNFLISSSIMCNICMKLRGCSSRTTGDISLFFPFIAAYRITFYTIQSINKFEWELTDDDCICSSVRISNSSTSKFSNKTSQVRVDNTFVVYKARTQIFRTQFVMFLRNRKVNIEFLQSVFSLILK
jgi:hypothetical protein